ncbi:PKD domain-containing protein [Hyunsoonleella ulvae]|uniref:PKD domain-containing protein n=1 Tax=Hyunsoonleella ulvae TaxID=2799948 RepID=UPI001939FA86|nr:PKD domain-containing protein [Hyunsoonleella ulvae]
MKYLLFLFALCLSTCSVFGQEIIEGDTLSRIATIKAKTIDNSVIFTPETPTLNQIAGAPKAFYTFFWEFGDGHYSKEKNPKHTYKTKGNYEVRLWATNNYDTGKPPTTRPKKIAINSVSSASNDMASMDTDFDLIRNREPVPSQDIVTVMRYKNIKDYTTKGKLYIFYNEQKFSADNFVLKDTRTYYNEKDISTSAFAYTDKIDAEDNTLLASTDNSFLNLRVIAQDSTDHTNLPLTIAESKAYYKNWSILEFDNMSPNEERNVFFSFETTPEMVKDTSAIISVRGIYVPDSNYDNHKIKDMEMEIVTSHDPNKMSSNGTFMNYRFVRFKTLKYKIKFQNNGEGPAKTIRLETDIPEMLDKSTLKVTDMYPKCEICPKYEVAYSCLDTTFTNTQAIFTFKNIYLPGSEQKNVKVYDSTKGFVKYNIKFAKDFHKKKTKSRTAIIFDKNEPIITNYSTTRFLPGISIGVKAGYNHFSDLKNSESYFIGATLSPYKAFRWYWQVELMSNLHSYNSNTQVAEEIISEQGFRFRQRTTTYTSYENIDLDIPVMLRYNINNYIGLGAGLQNTISVNEKSNNTVLIEQFEGISPDAPIFNSNEEISKQTNSFTNLRTGILFEATAGFARIGPSLGARYILNFEDNFNYWQFYAIWKF